MRIQKVYQRSLIGYKLKEKERMRNSVKTRYGFSQNKHIFINKLAIIRFKTINNKYG